MSTSTTNNCNQKVTYQLLTDGKGSFAVKKKEEEDLSKGVNLMVTKLVILLGQNPVFLTVDYSNKFNLKFQ